MSYAIKTARAYVEGVDRTLGLCVLTDSAEQAKTFPSAAAAHAWIAKHEGIGYAIDADRCEVVKL